jgi:pimeloyl-ACP methyl ester carboxylesterase
VSGVIAAVVLTLAGLFLGCAAAPSAVAAQYPRGAAHEIVFTRYSPLFGNAQILRRLLSPLAQESIRESLARSHEVLAPYAVDLARQRFLVYVPPGAPPSPRGFALLVFVPPWDQARLPSGWALQLNHYGVIFVTPADAGNTAAVLSRRVPLALAAEENIVREYPVDPEHIYVGGFSGGSRVALRVALGFPDVFRGALLNAGADPLGGGYPLPPRNLLQRFQSSSRLVYVTGDLDTASLTSDANSVQSLRDWCVFDAETHETPDTGHEVMSPEAFGQALGRLLSRAHSGPARLDACRTHVRAALQAQLGHAKALISRGNRSAAHKLLLEIDERYGGLAAPQILALARSCGCGLAQP